MSDNNMTFVFENREPKDVDELLDEFVKSELGIVKKDDEWEREEEYDNDAYLSLLKRFYKERVPNGNWNIFITGWWNFWERSTEELDNYFDNDEADYWFNRATEFISELWDAGLKKEDNND